MACDKYWELLSARLDGALSEDEERELEEHLTACPDCRAVGAQLSALQEAFPELEEVPAPEGFAQGVMGRVRALEPPKVIPLFKRPQFRALAGLAACLAVVVGLYGAGQSKKQEDWDMAVRSFTKDVQVEEFSDASACETLGGEEDGPMVNAAQVAPEPAEAPPTAFAYTAAAPDAVRSDDYDRAAEKSALGAAVYGGAEDYAETVLTLDRMPEGGWELIPPDTPVSPDGLTVSVELMEQLAQLAEEQNITASRTTGPESSDQCLIVILDETK